MEIRKDDVNNKWEVKFNNCRATMVPEAGHTAGGVMLTVRQYTSGGIIPGKIMRKEWHTSLHSALSECWGYYTNGRWSWEADEE